MSDELKVGDKVVWARDNQWCSGEVVSAHPYWLDYVYVERVDGGRVIAPLVDDYAFAVGQAGSLGGVELI